MRIVELAEQTGTSERQIRYLIAEGFVPAPRGGRANADYGEDHVAAVERYTRLRDLGFPPAAIKLLLEAKQGAPFPVVPGVTLVVDPGLVASGDDVEPLVQRLRQILNSVFKESRHARHRQPNHD